MQKIIFVLIAMIVNYIAVDKVHYLFESKKPQYCTDRVELSACSNQQDVFPCLTEVPQ